MTWLGILEDIVGSVLYTVILVLAGIVLVRMTHRVRLLRFFGVTQGRRIVVYLSNLGIVEGGALGLDDRRRSYQGHAVPFLEVLVAGRFRDLFNYPIPSLSDGPSTFGRLLLSDVQVDLLHSPLRIRDVEQTSPFISLGGPAYNSASALIEAQLDSQVAAQLGSRPRWLAPAVIPPNDAATGLQGLSEPTVVTSSASVTGAALAWPGSAGMGTASTIDVDPADVASARAESEAAFTVRGVPGDFADPAHGFVERLVEQHDAGTRFVFYAAGISELATAGAAHFLATRWRQLERKYRGDTPFLVVLRVEGGDHTRWSIVFERSGARSG